MHCMRLAALVFMKIWAALFSFLEEWLQIMCYIVFLRDHQALQMIITIRSHLKNDTHQR
jgi:hypothetical protein